MSRLSFTQPADFLKERDFGQKLEATFDFIRAHFKPLGKCLLYIVLPIALLNGVARGLLQQQLSTYFQQIISARGNSSVIWSSFGEFIGSAQYLVVFLTSFITLIFLVLSVYGYMVLRLRNPDPSAEITVTEVWALVRARLLSTTLAFFGLGFIFGLSFLPFVGLLYLATNSGLYLGLLLPFLYVFTLYVLIALSLFFIIWVREELGFFATLRRCFYLIWGKWWSTFGLLLITVVIISLITVVVAIPTGVLNASSFLMPEAEAANPILVVVFNTLSALAMTLLYPLIFIALAFQYFNLVERKDGEGLRSLVDRLGQPATAAPLHPEDRYRPEEEGDY